MQKYILSRLGQTFFVLILVTLLTFIMLNVVPGDPVRAMLQRADEATIARVREQLGLNRPLHIQYLSFVGNALKGDLGNSYFDKRPVFDMLNQCFQITALLSITSLFASLVFGLLIGSLAAIFRGTLVDRGLMLLATAGMSAPIFWVAVLLQIALGLYLGVLPISGQQDAGWMVMPVICLGLAYGAGMSRLVRTNVIDILTQDYVRTARSKGIGEFAIVTKHVMKNAGIPIITISGMQLRSLLSGAMVLEVIFSIRGMGKLAYDAIMKRDIPLIQGCVLYAAVIFVLINLFVDLLYGMMDPRVRVSRGE